MVAAGLIWLLLLVNRVIIKSRSKKAKRNRNANIYSFTIHDFNLILPFRCFPFTFFKFNLDFTPLLLILYNLSNFCDNFPFLDSDPNVVAAKILEFDDIVMHISFIRYISKTINQQWFLPSPFTSSIHTENGINFTMAVTVSERERRN